MKALQGMFSVIHRWEQMTPGRFQRKLERTAELALRVGRLAPDRSETLNLAERFRKHGDAYFRFVATPGIEPTNNLAEQTLRFVVIDQRITHPRHAQREGPPRVRAHLDDHRRLCPARLLPLRLSLLRPRGPLRPSTNTVPHALGAVNVTIFLWQDG